MSRSVAELIDAWEQTLVASAELVSDLSETEWRLATCCPGWDVHDHVAHLGGLESELAGRPLSGHVAPDLSHLHNPFAVHMEAAVDERRAWSHERVLQELRDVTAERAAQLRGAGLALDTMVTGPMGRQSKAQGFLGIRAFDAWTHEQDIRAALDRPGNLDSPAARIACERLIGSLAHMARSAGLTDQQIVAVEVTGPVTMSGVSGEGEPVATLRMDTHAFTRLGCGRVGPGDAAVQVVGDADVARAFLGAMAITP